MKNARLKSQIEGTHTTVIGAGLFDYVSWGATALGNILNVRDTPYLRFGALYDVATVITIEGSLDSLTFMNVEVLNLAASTFGSVYSFPAPRNTQGQYVLQMPWLRIKVAVPGGVGSTVQRLYAVVSNYRG